MDRSFLIFTSIGVHLAKGSTCRSSDLPEGWAHDEFFYYSGNSRHALSNAGWCKGGMIWGEVIASDGKSTKIQKFFVGNEDQFRMEVDPTGKTYSPLRLKKSIECW